MRRSLARWLSVRFNSGATLMRTTWQIPHKGQSVRRTTLGIDGATDIGAEKPEVATWADPEKAIDRILSISSGDEVTSEDHAFVLSFPKEAIPLVIHRLEQRLKGNAIGSDPFGLLTVKLKQFDGEIPDETRRAAINVLVATCESDDDSRLLMHLSGLRGLKDRKIKEMALRMKTRTENNVPEAAAMLLATIDSAQKSGETSEPGKAINTPAPMPIVDPSQVKPSASQSPAMPVAQTPAPAVERTAPVWPWIVGILALIVIVAVALKRRA